MEMRRWWWTRWLRLIVAVSTWWQWEVAKCVDPQSLSVICGGAAATNVSDFIKNMNATFSDLRSQLSDEKHFATAQYANISQPVYGRAQCRNYMSQSDCLACYDAAVSVIRNCSDTNVTAAELNSDDCSLRYDDYEFFKESTDNGVECSNITSRSVAELTEFVAAGERLLSDLARATAKTKDYFAATKRGSGAGNSTIYGVAQCAETITEEHCAVCLSEARVSLQNRVSFSADDGRAWGAACFMRYTNNSFFDDQHVTNIQSLIGKNSTTAPIIGGVIAAAILLIISFALLWYKYSRQLRKALIGNILGATELQQPKRYNYEDLKAATNGFSEEYKLGQGGFGAVYKAILTNETVVAVKKLNIGNDNRAKADFETEVRLISNVHHRNVVRLLGCCTKGTELLLVYEYMKNASLDRFLYGKIDPEGSARPVCKRTLSARSVHVEAVCGRFFSLSLFDSYTYPNSAQLFKALLCTKIHHFSSYSRVEKSKRRRRTIEIN